jgi:hypothetical protein
MEVVILHVHGVIALALLYYTDAFASFICIVRRLNVTLSIEFLTSIRLRFIAIRSLYIDVCASAIALFRYELLIIDRRVRMRKAILSIIFVHVILIVKEHVS